MGFIANFILSNASKANERALDETIQWLRGMDAAELGLLVVIATDFRNRSGQTMRTALLDFHTLSGPAHSTTPLAISTHINKIRDDKALVAGMMIWLHTARAAQDHRLRFKAKQMWAELGRGFPMIRDGEFAYFTINGNWPSVLNAGDYPEGLDPAA
jgi:hypothetical protein